MAIAAPPLDSADRQWFIVGRWQEYEGEARANLLRIAAVTGFYAIELASYYGFRLGPFELPATMNEAFHQVATGLTVAWMMVALATLLCLKLKVFPAFLKYATTAADLVLLTTLLLAAEGPRSALVAGYFVIIALAALRLQRRLVWFATLGSMAGYLVLCGYAKWYAPTRDLVVPRYQELIVLLSLALCGITLGQVIRRVRAMAEDFARRLEAHGERLT